jgi:hypothetical protein
MIPESFRVVEREVRISATKKSLNLTVPKGEITIMSIVQRNSILATLKLMLKKGSTIKNRTTNVEIIQTK